MLIDKSDVARELLNRRKARKDLYSYITYTKPWWVDGAHHHTICEALQRLEQGQIKRLMIQTPPRHSKSLIVSEALPAWLLGRNPDWQVICASYNDELSTFFASKVRDAVKSDEYQRIFSGTQLHPDAKAKALWRTVQGGIYRAVSVGSGATGWGADIIIIDDPIKGRNEADSPVVRNRTWNWIVSDLMTRLMPGGRVVLMATRWHEDDPAARARLIEDWEIITLPAISNENTDNEQALWPEYWSLDEMQAVRKRLLKDNRIRDWESLYQQNPKPDTGSYCLREWFDNRYKLVELPDHLNIYISSDFAVTESSGDNDPDFTEHGVFGVCPDGFIYVLDWWHGQTNSDVWINELIRLIKKWEPSCWFGEKGQILNGIEPFLIKRLRQQQVYVRKEYFQPKKNKMERGRIFQAMASDKLFRFPANEEWAQRVIENCIGFPGLTHDDAFDVLTLLCQALDKIHEPYVKSTVETINNDYTMNTGYNQNTWKTR